MRKQVLIRLTESMIEQLDERADNQNVSRSAYIENLIAKDLESDITDISHDNGSDEPDIDYPALSNAIKGLVEEYHLYLLHGDHCQEENPGNAEYGFKPILDEGMLRSIKSAHDRLDYLIQSYNELSAGLKIILFDLATKARLDKSRRFQDAIIKVDQKVKPEGFGGK